MALRLNLIKLSPERAAVVGDGLKRVQAGGEDAGRLENPIDPQVEEAMGELVESSAAVGGVLIELKDQNAGRPLLTIDRVLDRLVAALCDLPRVKLRMLTLEGVLPLTEAEAQRVTVLEDINANLAPKGRGFLHMPYQEQWRHVAEFTSNAQRWIAPLGDAEWQATLERTELLNQHYGAFQGLVTTPATPLTLDFNALKDTAKLTVAMARFEKAARMYALRVFNQFWDDDSDAHLAARQLLLRALEIQFDLERADRK